MDRLQIVPARATGLVSGFEKAEVMTLQVVDPHR